MRPLLLCHVVRLGCGLRVPCSMFIMRHLSARLRFFRLFTHLGVGVLTVFFLFPFLDRAERGRRLVRWAGKMLATVSTRVVVRGRPPTVRGGGVLIVANHVSWLDIHVIHSLLPARFISKAEVRDWPVIGWLADKAGGTLFLERTRKADAKRMNELMADHLREGECLALFPEGTTSDGRSLLPFYASLFQPAVSAGATVHPAVIRYLNEQGDLNDAPAYFGEMSLLDSLRNIVGRPGIVAEVTFLPAIPAQGTNRRDIAARSEAAIRSALVAGEPDNPPETAVRRLA
jgi:1-acyl-sn-glycerol-3-phosphate acyltransferase